MDVRTFVKLIENVVLRPAPEPRPHRANARRKHRPKHLRKAGMVRIVAVAVGKNQDDAG